MRDFKIQCQAVELVKKKQCSGLLLCTPTLHSKVSYLLKLCWRLGLFIQKHIIWGKAKAQWLSTVLKNESERTNLAEPAAGTGGMPGRPPPQMQKYYWTLMGPSRTQMRRPNTWQLQSFPTQVQQHPLLSEEWNHSQRGYNARGGGGKKKYPEQIRNTKHRYFILGKKTLGLSQKL